MLWVYLFVCLFVGLLKWLWPDLHEAFTRRSVWPNSEVI